MGSGTLWAGTNVWTSLGPEGGPIQALAIDPQTPSTIYGAASGGIFKTTNSGTTWNRVYFAQTSVVYPVPVLAIDPQSTSTVYAGGGYDVLKSTDGGASWSAMNSGLP